MGEVVRAVSEATRHEAILVTDVGQNQMISARYFKYTKERSIVTSGGLTGGIESGHRRNALDRRAVPARSLCGRRRQCPPDDPSGRFSQSDVAGMLILNLESYE